MLVLGIYQPKRPTGYGSHYPTFPESLVFRINPKKHIENLTYKDEWTIPVDFKSDTIYFLAEVNPLTLNELPEDL